MSCDAIVETAPTGVLADEIDALTGRYLNELHQRLGRLCVDGDDRQLAAAAVTVERALRSGEAAAATIVGAVDRRGLFLNDGHHNVKAWLVASVQMDSADAGSRQRFSKFLSANPTVADALTAGQLGVGQARRLEVGWRKTRIRDEFNACLPIWLACALEESFERFRAQFDEWVRLVDQDGGHRERDDAHRDRDCWFALVGDTMVLQGQFAGLQGEALQQVFERFVDAEYRFDVDEAKHRLGVDQVTEADLARTSRQRRADAMVKLVLAGAGAPPDGKQIDVTVDIVIDQTSFEEQLLDVLDPLHQFRQHTTPNPPSCGFDPNPPTPTASSYLDGVGVHREHDGDCDGGCDGTCQQAPAQTSAVRSMCHTRHGTPVHPLDAVTAALIGHVRRVVIGADGVVIALGRRSRLYKGSSREAIFLQAAIDGLERCTWPGCGRKIRQIDHSKPHSEGGPTDPCNGGGMCPPQPDQNPRLHHPPRPQRQLAPLPTRRHRNPPQLTTPTRPLARQTIDRRYRLGY